MYVTTNGLRVTLLNAHIPDVESTQKRTSKLSLKGCGIENHFEHLGVHGRTILKWILKEQDRRM
jgi:hypothetical protein